MSAILEMPETDREHAARLLRVMLRGLTPMVLLLAATDASQAPDLWPRWAWLAFAALALAVCCLAILRAGRVRLAAVVLLVSGWAVTTFLVATGPRLVSADTGWFLLWVFAAGLLLGRIAGYVAAAAAVTTLVAIAAADAAGWLQSPIPYEPAVALASHAFAIVLIAALQALSSSLRAEALRAAQARLEERRRTERALEESERRTRDLFDATQDGILVLDPSRGTVLDANRCAADMLGFEPAALPGTTAATWSADADVFSPARFAEKLAAATEAPQAFEWCCRSTNGVPLWVDARLQRTTIAGETRILATFRARDRSADETASLLAALTSSEERYRIVAEQTGQIVYDFDMTSGRILWEGAIEAITGFPRSEFSRFDIVAWENLIHPEDRQSVVAELDAAGAAGRVFHAEYRFRRKDGSFTEIEDTGIFVCDTSAKPFRLLGLMKDVSRHKQSEARLREINQRVTFHFERMPLGYIAWNREFLVTEWNPAAERMFGWTAEEAIGRHAYELIVPADVRPTVDRIWNDLLSGGEWSSHSINDNCRKDGSRLVCEWFNAPLRDERGQIAGCLSIIHDITERRKAEEVEAKLKAELVQAQKLQALGTLAGGIAHDFNNILTALSGHLDLAREELPGDHPLQRRLAAMEEASHRASALVRHILTFSRREASQRKILDLAATVSEALILLRASIPAMVEFKPRFDHATPPISADPTQIHQIVMNLGTNAAQAIGDRKGTITFTVEPASVRPGTAEPTPDLPPGIYAKLSVADTGSGMDPGTRDRIFEPFFTTKERGRGTGLGLSVVHGIVQGHQGAIAVQSAPGKGTRFEIYFPATKEKPETPSLKPPARAKGYGERVLVVDDEEAIVGLTCEGLERFGYRCTGHADPEKALAAFLAAPDTFDAVITDFAMPVIPGSDLIAKMRAVRPELPVLFMSGYVQKRSLDQLAGLGIVQIVQKPVSVKELAKELDCLLYKHRLGTDAQPTSRQGFTANRR